MAIPSGLRRLAKKSLVVVISDIENIDDSLVSSGGKYCESAKITLPFCRKLLNKLINLLALLTAVAAVIAIASALLVP